MDLLQDLFDEFSDDESSDDEAFPEIEDDGYDTGANDSDPEDIVLDKRFPEPLPMAPDAIPLNVLNGEPEEPVNRHVIGRPRQLDVRREPYARKVSRGFDDEDRGVTLRSSIRLSELRENSGLFNGFAAHRPPRRIIGMTIKRRKLYYIVEWYGQYYHTAIPIEAEVMTEHSPQMVIKFHQNMVLNPKNYHHL